MQELGISATLEEWIVSKNIPYIRVLEDEKLFEIYVNIPVFLKHIGYGDEYIDSKIDRLYNHLVRDCEITSQIYNHNHILMYQKYILEYENIFTNDNIEEKIFGSSIVIKSIIFDIKEDDREAYKFKQMILL